MQLAVTVRFVDVIAFYIDSLTRELSALSIGGTLVTLLSAFLAQSYIRAGTPMLITTAISAVVFAGVCAALFYGFVALMALLKRDENQPTGNLQYGISATGVVLRTADEHYEYTWDSITNIGYSDRFVWIHIDHQHYRFIPRAALASDEQLAAVWQALEQAARSGG